MGAEKAVDLRAMVREVLHEALAARGAGGGAASAVSQPARITSDAELQAFVAHLARPGVIEAVRAGNLHFTLTTGQCKAAASVPAILAQHSVTLDGVISERRLQMVPKCAAVHLAPGAVLTPLARDVARRLGLKLHRRDT